MKKTCVESDLKEIIKDFIGGLDESFDVSAINYQTNLIEAGFLDSLSVVKLVSHIGSLLDRELTFDCPNIGINNFESIEKIHEILHWAACPSSKN